MTFDTIIKGGTLLDGVANDQTRADVGIKDGVIAEVGNLGEERAQTVIDAEDRMVAPGFVDAQNHSDSYFTLLEIPSLPSMVSQGITTMAVGHCGTSLAPLVSPEALRSIQKWHSVAGANINWSSFDEYLNVLSKYSLGANVLSLIGHSTVRRGLIGDQARAANKEEVKIIEKLLLESLAAGGGGVSFGLAYAHEADASVEEIISGAKLAAKKDRLVSIHLRSEGQNVISALSEAIDIARQSKARLKISHFKIRGEKNWPLLEQALREIERAYEKGVDVGFDVYPYHTSWTVLYTYLPKWASEGGRAAILKNLKDPQQRAKILTHLHDQGNDLGSIHIATSETNPGLVGKTLAEVAVNQEVSVEEALLNVLSATESQVIVFDHNLSDDVVDTLLAHPLSIVATDGAGYDFGFTPSHGLVHPRCFGTMPQFLSWVREKKKISWADAIKKITSRPAQKLGLKDRGRIKAKLAADIVVFDPAEIGSRASYENPYQQADGIEYVLVNGEVAYHRGVFRESAGKVLRA